MLQEMFHKFFYGQFNIYHVALKTLLIESKLSVAFCFLHEE